MWHSMCGRWFDTSGGDCSGAGGDNCWYMSSSDVRVTNGLRLAAGQASAASGAALDTEAVARDNDPWFGYGWCFSKLLFARAELGDLDMLSNPDWIVQHSDTAEEESETLDPVAVSVGSEAVVDPDGPEVMSAEQWAVAIVSSEAFMWLMVGANHPESHLETLRDAYDQYRDSGGKTWGRD
jgi:hypothetical protein